MRKCPFCDFNEGWTIQSPFDKSKYVVQCYVCGAMGPESQTREGAEKKWDGYLKEIDAVKDKGLFDLALDEDAMGGVSAPASTSMNVPGMGNAVPAGPGTRGSGDSFGKPLNKKPYAQSVTKKKKTPIEEENINPYDKIGMAMAKKMKVKPPFTKKKEKGNQNAMKQRKFEHEIITLDDFKKQLNESHGLQINYDNTYWEVLMPFFVYVQTGSRPSNAYYGSSRIHQGVYEKLELEEGDQIHALVGGTFIVKKNGRVYKGAYLKEPEFRPFEHGNRDYDNWEDYIGDNLQQITSNSKINKPKSYN